MYCTIDDFISDWQNEAKGTQKLLERLSDASLEQRVDEVGRTLGGLAWHIVLSPGEFFAHTGVHIDGPSQDTPQPNQAIEIANAYREVAHSVAEKIGAEWADSDLGTKVEMYGEEWSKATVLSILIRHEAHHRGQMTVLMRQAGLAVPGIYGPTREEWQAMGIAPLP